MLSVQQFHWIQSVTHIVGLTGALRFFMVVVVYSTSGLRRGSVMTQLGLS